MSLRIRLSLLLSLLPALSGQPATDTPRLQGWQQHQTLLASSGFRALHWESLGPSLQGGRVGAIAVAAPGSSTFYVGPGAGNVWKTTDNGMTWTPIFEHQSAFAIGDIAVAPSNPDIVWVGTGEMQPRFDGPSFPGTGVFQSRDAGKTWRDMGLHDTGHIGKIAIDPHNPDVVYVAALGHTWSHNSERGLFRSRDGGKTWQKMLFISDSTGVIDVEIDPSDSQTLYASAWQLPSGPESGLYRSIDGGSHWTKLTAGLPAGPLGRSHIAIAPGNPRVVYAFLDNAAPFTGMRGRETVGGEVYHSDDRGQTWRKANTDDLYQVFSVYGWKFCDIQVSPANENEIFILGNRAFHSTDGGKTYQRVGETIRRVHDTEGTALHLDQHALWIDPANPNRLLLGNDGGVFQSYDRGRTWLHLNNLPIGQFYTVTYDLKDPYTIFASTQDNGALYVSSNYHPDDTHAANDGWHHVWLDQWTGGDAYLTLPDPTDPRLVYFEQQNGYLQRMDLSVGTAFTPSPAVQYIAPRAPAGDPPWRFAFNTPYLISQFNPHTLYMGGNLVVKSFDRGATWRAISPDFGEPAGHERDLVHYGAVTTLAESPLASGLLYAGMEGGDVFVTRNDGRSWDKISATLPPKWVSRVTPSQYDLATVYLALSGLRSDDPAAYLYRSTDYGATWTSIAHNLPAESINVVREDPREPQILYVGTDAGVYISRDRGETWESLCGDLPTTPVEDLAVQPIAGEILIATHGRGIFLLDAHPLESLTPAVTASAIHVFEPRPITMQFHPPLEIDPLPPAQANVYFWLSAPQTVHIVVRNIAGSAVATIDTAGVHGMNQVVWDVRGDAGRLIPAGKYRVEVSAGEAHDSAPLTIRPMPR